MNVYVYPADVGGCGYYRLIWVARYLRSLGHNIKLIHPKNNNKFAGIIDPDDKTKLVDIAAPSDADVIVLQRVTSIKMVSGIQMLRARGIAVVIDIDDDMRAIHPNNPVFSSLSPSTGGHLEDYSWVNADKVYAAATLVTASTDALLKRYARYDPATRTYHGRVLRNCVPSIYLDIVPRTEENTIGWGGMILSHPDDPPVCGTSMGELQRQGFTFKIVGPGAGTKRAFMLDNEAVATGPVGLDQWPHSINRFAVGIAPLKLTRFNEAKSWLKPLEYAALGVPVIMSPTTEYVRLHRMGVGVVASTPKEWYRHGRALLESDARRYEMMAAGRSAVSSLTIEANAWRWLETWEDALHIERQTHPKLSVATVPAAR